MPVSYWVDSTSDPDYPPLNDGIDADVAVVGAGITGLTTALLLTRAGKRVAVIDASRVGSGVTGYTTAKVTAGHALIYSDLADRLGEDAARVYAESNQAAIERVAAFVEEERIDCGFEWTENFVYTETGDEVEQVRAEVAAAQRAGLSASFVTETALPYPVLGAYRLERQGQFHPRKYVLALAAAVERGGGRVFQFTRARAVREGRRLAVETERAELRARDVVLATHIPFMDRGLFFVKTHPYRGYALMAEIDDRAAPRGMYLTASHPSRTVRTVRDDGRTLLLVGGESHKPGEEPDTRARYRAIESFLRERFAAGEITHRWSTQDYMSVDHVPYVGKLTRGSDHLYTATGFRKWGLTNGTVAAMILSDTILGRRNPWGSLYASKRLNPRASAAMFARENGQVALHWIGDRLRPSQVTGPHELAAGDGAVMRVGREQMAVSRDGDGTLHAVSATCTHLGCIVAWNSAEQSWDCPCHGSRFSPDGKVIQGPAVDDLEQKALPA